MKYLFSHDGRPALKRLCAGNKVLIALDFDGTLAPIVHEPPHARMTQSIATELDRLCAVAPVAIISGRELGDLQQRVSARATWLIGNHGNEGLAAIPVDGGGSRKICAGWTRQLRRMPEMQTAGVFIEPKGYTLALHYRLAKDHLGTQAMLVKAFDQLTPPPRLVHGKCVFDLIPPGAVCKDDALKFLARQEQPDTVLYVGDDECDELVFAAACPDWVTIRVGYWSHSEAKYYLRYQREVGDLLRLLNLQLGVAAATDAD